MGFANVVSESSASVTLSILMSSEMCPPSCIDGRSVIRLVAKEKEAFRMKGFRMNATEKWIVGIVIGGFVSVLFSDLFKQQRWEIALPYRVD